jgi:hypothetical protein
MCDTADSMVHEGKQGSYCQRPSPPHHIVDLSLASCEPSPLPRCCEGSALGRAQTCTHHTGRYWSTSDCAPATLLHCIAVVLLCTNHTNVHPTLHLPRCCTSLQGVSVPVITIHRHVDMSGWPGALTVLDWQVRGTLLMVYISRNTLMCVHTS